MKKTFLAFSFAMVFFTCSLPLFAQEGSPTPPPDSVVVTAVNTANSHMPLALPTLAVTGILLVLDFVARKWPSASPMGVLHTLSGLFGGLALFFQKLASYSDQLISQNLTKKA